MPAPHLRIIPEELWLAAHAKIAEARHVTNTRRVQRDSQYVLPGLARCAWCNGGLYAHKRTRTGRQADMFYACTSHHKRGAAVCRNVVQVVCPTSTARCLARSARS